MRSLPPCGGGASDKTRAACCVEPGGDVAGFAPERAIIRADAASCPRARRPTGERPISIRFRYFLCPCSCRSFAPPFAMLLPDMTSGRRRPQQDAILLFSARRVGDCEDSARCVGVV